MFKSCDHDDAVVVFTASCPLCAAKEALKKAEADTRAADAELASLRAQLEVLFDSLKNLRVEAR